MGAQDDVGATSVNAGKETGGVTGGFTDYLRRWFVSPTPLVIAGFIVFWLLFFWSILVRRSHFIPWDLLDQHYMFQGFIQRTRDAGESLWWSPNIMGGYPIMADPLAAYFYPPNFLMHLIIPRELLPYLALELQATLHFLLAAIGMFLLARMLTGSAAGGAIAGLAWAFSSYFVWHLPHLSPISTLSWLPWILFAYINAVRQGSLLWTTAAALATGFMMLAGHAMTILQVTYLLIGVVIVLVWQRWGENWRTRVMPAVVAGTTLALGAGIAAVQLLPAWHLSSQSERADFGFAAAADSSFAPYWSITALLPNFFSVFDPGEYWAAGDPAETNLYMGLIPLFLAVIGIAAARAPDRRATFLLAGGAFGAMLLAFGVFAWPFQLAYDLLPGIDRVRRPVTFIALAQFAVALLAAYGVKALSDSRDHHLTWSRVTRWLGIGAVVMAGVAAATAILMVMTIGEPTQQQFISIVSGAVVAALLLTAGYAIGKTWSRRLLSTGAALTLLVLLLAIDLGSAHKAATYRNEEMPPNAYIGLDWAYNQDNNLVRGLQEDADAGDPFRILPDATASVWANGPFIWDLHSASGYIVLCPVAYCDLLNIARSDPASPIFDLLNIRYLVTDHEIGEHYGDAAVAKFDLAFEEHSRVYENPDALPRAWIARRSVHQPEGAVLPYLLENQDELGEVVVLSDPAAPVVDSSDAAPGAVEIIEYENTSVMAQAEMDEAGYLVLADTYFPGWSVTVNGDGAEIFRANHAFRAVYLPEGEHLVEFSYRQPWLREGAVISILAVFITLVIGGAGAVMRLRSHADAPMSSRPKHHRSGHHFIEDNPVH